MEGNWREWGVKKEGKRERIEREEGGTDKQTDTDTDVEIGSQTHDTFSLSFLHDSVSFILLSGNIYFNF